VMFVASNGAAKRSGGADMNYLSANYQSEVFGDRE
jgi:hypothetical protein